MADNVPVTAGSGVSIAADDIGGVHHQRVKIGVGADGTAVDVQPPDADGKASSGLFPAGNMVWNGATWDRARLTAGDGLPVTGLTSMLPSLWNGATHDRQRGNTEGTLLASAARTVATASATQTNHNARGVIVWLNVTAVPGSGGIAVAVAGVDPTSGQPYQMNATATTVTANGKYAYELYPGATGTGVEVAQRTSGALPRTWYVAINVGNAASYTYSVGYSLIV
jgi:hypothetical protein